MNNFQFYSPTWFEFGKGTEAQTGALVKRFGGSRVLIHYGGGSVVRSGLLDRVKASLDEAGVTYVELGGAQPNPLSGKVYEGIDLARKEKVDFILAVGGGSAIDSAKAIAFGTLYDGDFWDFYDGTKGQVQEALPLGVVLTIAATGSEASGDAVVTNENGMYKRCADGDILRPRFSIMNPELTCTLPPYQTASGCFDMFSHCLERYFSDTPDVDFTDRLLEACMKSILMESRRVMADPNDYEARANLMWTGTIAHNNMTGVGRAQDWGTHHMENELSTHYGCSHGEGLAILTPSWLKYAMKHKDINRFVMLANRVFGCEINFEDLESTANEGIQRLQNFIVQDLKLHSKITEIGGKPEDAPELTRSMFYGAPNHGSFIKLTPEIAEEIYRMAM